MRHLCGFDDDPRGWRKLADAINAMPALASAGMRLAPTRMDSCRTIKHIEASLAASLTPGLGGYVGGGKRKSRKKTAARKKAADPEPGGARKAVARKKAAVPRPAPARKRALRKKKNGGGLRWRDERPPAAPHPAIESKGSLPHHVNIDRVGGHPPPAASEPPKRYANAALLEASTGRLIFIPYSLPRAAVVRLRLDIGAQSPESQVKGPVAFPDDKLPKDIDLEVMVSSTDFAVGRSVGEIARDPPSVAHGAFHLPGDGSAAKAPDGGKYLVFYLRAPTELGIAHCRIGYYFRNVLVQSQQLRAAIGQSGGWSINPDFTLSESLSDFDAIPARPRLSVLTNANGDGVHQIIIRRAEAPAATPAVAASGKTFVIKESNVAVTIGKLRKALTLCAPLAKARRRADLIEDLRQLAPLGWSLYTQMGAALDDALFDWKNKADPFVIQVLRPTASSFVFPWALCYDIPLDSQTAPVLCPLIDKWDGRAPLFEGLPRTCPRDHPRANVLCPFGFLGFRYAIEQLSSTDQPVLTIATAPSCDFAVAQTQYAISDPRALAAHIATLRALGAGAKPPSRLSEGKDRAAVQSMLGRDLSLVYFYCHGGRASDADPNTYLCVGNNEPITAQDFIGWLKSWREAYNKRIWSDVRPLVFINACHSLAIEPETLVSYLDAFVTWGHAAGVIGTEVKVAQTLAMDVAEQFFRRLLGKQHTVETALHEIRIDYLASGNLLGLIYTPYCWADLRMN